MEEPTSPADAFINFANPNYGYGKLIKSCLQEEILLMSCPELLVGMTFIGRMGDDEVVNVRGVRRFSQYTGYLETFSCQGAVAPASDGIGGMCIQTILTMNACYDRHFTTAMISRDVGKACHSFALLCDEAAETSDSFFGPSIPTVSTGKWGCGGYGGVPAHKFVQQVLAANMAGVDLEFACFGSMDGCDELLVALHEHKPNARTVLQLLRECRDQTSFVGDAISFLGR